MISYMLRGLSRLILLLAFLTALFLFFGTGTLGERVVREIRARSTGLLRYDCSCKSFAWGTYQADSTTSVNLVNLAEFSSHRRIAIVTAADDDLSEQKPDDNSAKALCLTSQIDYCKEQHYQFTALKRSNFGGSTKVALILQMLMEELRKPAALQLRWLFWFDRNAYIANPKIPLHTFIPGHDFNHVNLLVTNRTPSTDETNTADTSVFAVRVSGGSVRLLMALLSMKTLRPQNWEPAQEASALGAILSPTSARQWRRMVTVVPTRWFSSRQPIGSEDGRNGSRELTHFFPGDLLLRMDDGARGDEYLKRTIRLAVVQPQTYVTGFQNITFQVPGIFWNDLRQEQVKRQKDTEATVFRKGVGVEKQAYIQLPMMKNQRQVQELGAKLKLWREIVNDDYLIDSDETVAASLIDDIKRINNAASLPTTKALLRSVRELIQEAESRNITTDEDLYEMRRWYKAVQQEDPKSISLEEKELARRVRKPPHC